MSLWYTERKIEGSTWYADGAFRNTPKGARLARKEANKIRGKGGNARVIKVTTHEIQVFTQDKKYLM